MTVHELIEVLGKYPPEAKVYAYEGELCGLIVHLEGKEIGYIEAPFEPSSIHTPQMEGGA